jgi:hypothetical protein
MLPSIRILFMSNEIQESLLHEVESYIPSKGVVINIKTLEYSKYPINYDKDLFKKVYQYSVYNLLTETNDTILETIKKNTYFFDQLSPTHQVSDTIVYYKNESERDLSILQYEFDFLNRNKNKQSIKWLSIVFIIVGVLFTVLLLKPEKS